MLEKLFRYVIAECGKQVSFHWNKFQVCREINENNSQREGSVFNISDKYLAGNNYLLTLSDSGLPPGFVELNFIEWLPGIN